MVEAEARQRPWQEVAVDVLCPDADPGTIGVSERVPAGRQPRLPFATP